jgi:hypothetical protein
MTLSKGIVLKAVVLAAMAAPMLSVSAWGQQEVDPSWYDPWAPAPKVAVHSAAMKATNSNQLRKVSSVSAERPRNKKQAKTARRSERTQTMASAASIRQVSKR